MRRRDGMPDLAHGLAEDLASLSDLVVLDRDKEPQGAMTASASRVGFPNGLVGSRQAEG